MKHLIKGFRAEEDGNSAIDWVCFAAGLLLLSSAIIATAIGDRSPDVLSLADTEPTLVAEL